jgi:Uncharacterised protein family (UPF0240)
LYILHNLTKFLPQIEQKRQINPEKPLPLARGHVEDFELGYQEPDVKRVTRGKCTLRQAIQFISDYQQLPGEWNAERIATEYKMKQENVEQILEHFRMFQVHIPKGEQHGNVKKFLIDPFDGKTRDFDKLLEKSQGKESQKSAK